MSENTQIDISTTTEIVNVDVTETLQPVSLECFFAQGSSSSTVVDVSENVLNIDLDVTEVQSQNVEIDFTYPVGPPGPAGSSLWGTISGTLSAQTDLWKYLSAVGTSNFDIATLNNYLLTNNILLCSLNVNGQILSAGIPLHNIFLTSETDAQTLSYSAPNYLLSISNGNTVNLSSLNDKNYVNANFLPLSGGTVNGNLYVLSSVYVAGSSFYIQAQDLIVKDPIIYIAEDNQADMLDTGIIASWTNAPGYPSGYQHGGLIRRADNKTWTLFSGATAEPLSGLNVEWAQRGIVLEPLSANFYGDIFGDRSVFGNLNVTNSLKVGNIYNSMPPTSGGFSEITVSGDSENTNITQSILFKRGIAQSVAFTTSNLFCSAGLSSSQRLDNTIGINFASALYSRVIGSNVYFPGAIGIGLPSTLPQQGLPPTSQSRLTVVGNISGTGTVFASGGNSNQWNSVYTTVLNNSASWEESADILPTVTNYLSTSNVLISALTITNTLSDLNSLTIFGNISGNNTRVSFNQGTATGFRSFATNTGQATGTNSFAEGNSTRAHGSGSHAEGISTLASGTGSHAEGNDNIASGTYAHVQGSNNEARGLISHAMGSRTRAVGDYSFAGGRRAVAKDNYSYVWATEQSPATREISSTRVGQYMVSASGGVFIPGNVGIGTDNNSNALTVVGNISGQNLRVSFNRSFAAGNNSFATNNAVASGNNSFAAAGGAAYGESSVALGGLTYGIGSYAERGNVATGGGSHAEGNTTIATGLGSHTEGNSTATGKRVDFNSYTNSTRVFTFTPETSGDLNYVTAGTILKGYDSDNLGDYFVFTVQDRSTVTGNITAVETIIGGDSSTGFIFNNSGNYAHAEGFESIASGLYSHAEGDYTEASGQASHAEGEGSVASGRGSHAESNGTASGDYSHAESGGIASGISSHAESGGTASGDNSHAEGLITTASGIGSHAEGSQTVASGNSSHAEGYITEASGQNSHAEGNNTKSLGESTHAEGSYTQAIEFVAHAEGYNTTAFGTVSHAEGRYTVAFGDTSHAAGARVTAAQNYTYAWSDGNLGTLTENVSTTRSGQYMVSASGGMFIPGNVGIGTDNNSNALTVAGNLSASKLYGDGSNLTNINFVLSSSNVTLSTTTLNPIAILSSTPFITSRVLQDKLGEVISVKDFGARGDGATNDWLPIQRALSAAAGIARVFIPGGLYFISQELRIPSNSYIYGAGIGSTVIKLSSTANATQCIMTNSQNTRSVATNLGNENIVIKDLELDGNVSRFPGSYSPVGDTSGTGLCLAYVKNALIERVAVHDTCRHCFDISAPETSITFDPLDYTPNPSFNIHLKDIIAYGAGDDNITTHFSHSIIIENAYVPYTGGTEVPTNSNGIEIDDGSYDITIIGGYIKNCRRGLEVKGHSWAPAAKRVKVYGLTCENNVRNFGIRHLGFDSTDSKTAFDVALYDCTSIAPVSSTATTDTPRSLQISNYDGVFVKDFKVVGEHNASRAITIQERARNVNFDGVTFTQISGAITGITDAMLYIDSTASRNITIRNAIFRDCIGLPIAAIGSIPGVIIDGVDASTSLSANPPARVIDFSWSPLDVPYIIRNVTMSGYLSAYQLGGSHDFDFPTTIDVGRITNIIPSSPATANTQYTVARFGWREGTGQGLNTGLGTRIEFTGSVVSGVSANTDLPVAYIGTRKVNATDSDVTSNLTFGTLSANNSTAVDRLTITPTGLVGINTTTPNERLTVVGNISATGTIQASSVISRIPLVFTTLSAYTLSLSDQSDLITINNSLTSFVYIPNDSSVNFGDGSQINITRLGTGTVTISASPGVVLRSADNRNQLRTQNSTATIVKLSANDWLLFGDIS